MTKKNKEPEKKAFYFQVKGKSDWGSWSFPPIYSDRVFAKDKKEAKSLIEEQFDRKLPLRVLNKDRDKEPFLLRITEITEDDIKTKSLFDIRECQLCGNEFRVIDHYNDSNEIYKGKEYCSNNCKVKGYERDKAFVSDHFDPRSQHPTVIYKITNKVSNLCYIGKTSQCFTLRWYQHFYHGGSSKFHSAIKSSKYTDWEFTIIEVLVEAPEGISNADYALERESYWIKKLNTIENGYNSVISRVSLDGSKEQDIEEQPMEKSNA